MTSNQIKKKNEKRKSLLLLEVQSKNGFILLPTQKAIRKCFDFSFNE